MTGPGGVARPDVVERWIVEYLCARLGVEPDAVDPAQSFAELGLASQDALAMTAGLEDRFGLTVDPLLVWDYPSPRALSRQVRPPGGGPR